MPTFPEVLKWTLYDASFEEQLALRAVLQFSEAMDPQSHTREGKPIEPPRDYPPMQVVGPLPGMTTEMQVLDRNGDPEAANGLKPGRYTAKVIGVTGKPVDKRRKRRRHVDSVGPAPSTVARLRAPGTYTPESTFAKKWWGRFQRSSVRMTPQQLATIGGDGERAKEVSTTLGNLFKRKIVYRWKNPAGGGYVYAMKGE